MPLSDVLSRVGGAASLIGDIGSAVSGNGDDVQRGQLKNDFNKVRYGQFGMPMRKPNYTRPMSQGVDMLPNQAPNAPRLSGGFGSIGMTGSY